MKIWFMVVFYCASDITIATGPTKINFSPHSLSEFSRFKIPDQDSLRNYRSVLSQDAFDGQCHEFILTNSWFLDETLPTPNPGKYPCQIQQIFP